MKQYIDKDKVIEELKKRIEKYKILHSNSQLNLSKIALKENIVEYNNFLSFLDTLEVKEVDLEKEIKEQIDKYYENCNKKLEEMGEDDNDISFLTLDGFARYFFELGLRSFVIEEDSKHIWKPNDKQMKALNAMKRYCEIATSFDAYTQEVVESLYQDLKKLKEK